MQVLLRGNCREELKKIKRAMQLAVFAAYHLSLETSFLADEGATVPRTLSMSLIDAPDLQTHRDYVSAGPADHSIPDNLRDAEEKYPHNASISHIFENISASSTLLAPSTLLPFDGASEGTVLECRASEFPVDHVNSQDLSSSCHPNASCIKHLISPCSLSDGFRTSCAVTNYDDPYRFLQSSIACGAYNDRAITEPCPLENCRSHPSIDNLQSGNTDAKDKLSAGYLSGTDNNQSILVSLSRTCIPKSLACERSHLLRIKFYGSFDKPLGRYLREDLFDQVLLILFCVTYYAEIFLSFFPSSKELICYFSKLHSSCVYFSGILLPIMQGAFRITC